MRPAPVVTVLLLAGLAVPFGLEAQEAPPRLAVSVGPDWLGEADVGGADATLTGAGGGRVDLFRTASTVTGGVGVGAAVGVRVAGGLWTELTARYHSARLATRITGDIEAADETAREALQQLHVDGGLLWLPEKLRLASRLQLFVAGGAGYLRQLHGTNTLAETGRSYYAGSGLIVSLPERQGGTFKASGVRLELRAAGSRGGVAFDDRLHVAPAIWASLFLRF